VSILSVQRGMHDIEDELVFANHNGYIFRDSRGLESGSHDELRIVQDFVYRRSQERRFEDRLHTIWFVRQGVYSCSAVTFAFQVLYSDGQSSAIVRYKTFIQRLPG
jgi:hypothetical protein